MLRSILLVSSPFIQPREAAYHNPRGYQDCWWLIWQGGELPWRMGGSCLSGTREFRTACTTCKGAQRREDMGLITEGVILPTVMR